MAFLMLTHPGGVTAAPFDAIGADLIDRGWSLALSGYALRVYVSGATPPPVQALIDEGRVIGAIVGELFKRAGAENGEGRVADLEAAGALAARDPAGFARVLAAETFGDYVGLVRLNHRGEPAAFCDPMGGRPAFAWRRDGVTLVGGQAPDGLAAPDARLDWARLGDIMADRRRAGAAPPLTGVTWLRPGTCRRGPDLADERVAWTPAGVVRDARRRDWPDASALRRTLDGVVRAQLIGSARVLCEISGGLDSAIVAATLAAVDRPADLAINFHRDQIEADERAYARAAAERARTPLRYVHRAPWRITAAGLTAGAGFFRPNFEIFDTGYDDLVLELLAETGADTIFTGHGGDVVFFQMVADALGVDLIRGAPCEGSRVERLLEVARRNRRSIWSLLAQAFRGRAPPWVMARRRAPLVLTTGEIDGASHPWVDGLGGLPEAKRAQIAGLAISQGVFSTTRRSAAARLRHPLFSQPVVEACLRIPATVLSQGEGERSFARAAFADRLPASIAQRRSKGDLSVFIGRTLAAGCGTLREFLLDGRLAQQGVVDRAVLESLLHPEVLIFRDVYGELLCAAVLEGYARGWEARALPVSSPPMGGGATAGETSAVSAA